MRPNFPEDLDTRPYPVWVQGFISGAAVALVIGFFVAYHVDHADGSLHWSTEFLMFAACVIGACAPCAYIPLTRAEALERHNKRIARRAASQGTQLRLVPSNNYNRTTAFQRRPTA